MSLESRPIALRRARAAWVLWAVAAARAAHTSRDRAMRAERAAALREAGRARPGDSTAKFTYGRPFVI